MSWLDRNVRWRRLEPALASFVLIFIYLPQQIISAKLPQQQHREHKVHNIVLYPDKHSWCNATPIVQVVAHSGCESVEVDNHVCVGACFSYSIPKTEPYSSGEVAPYCDSCQPSHTTWKQVTLKCSGGEYDHDTFEKKVEIIEGCHCSSCMKHGDHANAHGNTHGNNDQPQPQLMDLVYNSYNHSHNKDHLHLDTKTNHRLSLLLKRLSEEEDKGSLDKITLAHILSDIKTEDDETIEENLLPKDDSKEKIDEVAVDIVKLRHMLGKVNTHTHHNHRHLHNTEPQEEELGSPTLDVASHHLKPALPGSEISYLPDNVPSHEHGEPSEEKDDA